MESDCQLKSNVTKFILYMIYHFYIRSHDPTLY